MKKKTKKKTDNCALAQTVSTGLLDVKSNSKSVFNQREVKYSENNWHTRRATKQLSQQKTLGKKTKQNTGIKHRVQTCLGANPHGKLVYAGFPDLCAMLPDVAVAG